jgi:uncharacterized membrane protein
VRRGLVAGYFHATPDLLTHAFAWTAAAGLIDLGVPPGFQESFAFATNGEHVVGMIAAGFEAGYAQHAFVWRASHGIVDIGTLNGSSRALDVNEQGAVVGDFVRPAGGAGTFLWTEAGVCGM